MLNKSAIRLAISRLRKTDDPDSIDLASASSEELCAVLAGSEKGAAHSNGTINLRASAAAVISPTLGRDGYRLNRDEREGWCIAIDEEFVARIFGDMLVSCEPDAVIFNRLENGNTPLLIQHGNFGLFGMAGAAAAELNGVFGVGAVVAAEFGTIGDFRSGGNQSANSVKCLALKMKLADTENGRKTFGMLERGELRCVSIGFRAKEVELRELNKKTEHIFVKRWELEHHGLVDVGAAAQAVVLLHKERETKMSKPKIEAGTESGEVITAEQLAAARQEAATAAETARAEIMTAEKSRVESIHEVFKRDGLRERINPDALKAAEAEMLAPFSEATAETAREKAMELMLASPARTELLLDKARAIAPYGSMARTDGALILCAVGERSEEDRFDLASIHADAASNDVSMLSRNPSFIRLAREAEDINLHGWAQNNSDNYGIRRQGSIPFGPSFFNAVMSPEFMRGVMEFTAEADVTAAKPEMVQMSVSEYWWSRLAIARAGIRTRNRLPGDTILPIESTVPEATEEDETSEIAASNWGLSQVKTTPKRLGIYVPEYDKVRLITPINASQYIVASMMMAGMQKSDELYINGGGAANRIKGLLNTVGVTRHGLGALPANANADAENRNARNYDAGSYERDFREFAEQYEFKMVFGAAKKINAPMRREFCLVPEAFYETATAKLRFPKESGDRPLWEEGQATFLTKRIVASNKVPMNRGSRHGVSHADYTTDRSVFIYGDGMCAEVSLWQGAILETDRHPRETRTDWVMNMWHDFVVVRPAGFRYLDNLLLITEAA